MNNKTNQLNKLFEQWENEIPGYKGKFQRDGIINEELYNQAERKILFIEKEPNNPNQESGDYRDWWNEEMYYAFTYRIAEWSFGLLKEFPSYDKVWLDENEVHKMLKSIAFMNVKKIGGTGNSKESEMLEHAKKNFEFIHKQIEIIKPEIIITGFSWESLVDSIFPKVKWRKSGYDTGICKYGDAVVIDFYHPSSRNAPAASYSLLQNIINNNFKKT